jgi:O-antigen/teichoic acid export membrane protein
MPADAAYGGLVQDSAIVRSDERPARVLVSGAHLRRWSAQGFWAVLDQALFAVSNLLMNVLLARWLPPIEYGAFVTAYTVLLLVSVAHTALLSEPMLVFGAERYGRSFSQYFRVLRRFHWRLMAALGGALAAAALVLDLTGFTLLGQAVAGLTIAAPCILLGWLARRACYPVSRPRWAATAGMVNLLLVVSGTTLLGSLHALSVFSAQLVLAGAALCATVCMLVPLARVTDTPLSTTARAEVWAHHWNYGRWSGATGAFNWVQSYLYYLVLPIWGGLAAAGALKALLNLVMPILQSDAAILTLLMPEFARSRSTPGRFRNLVTWSAAAFAAESCLYWAGLLLFGGWLLNWLYGGAYHYRPALLVLLGIVPLLNGQLNVLGNALRAREQPDAVFWATVLSVVVACTLGLGAVAIGGVEGAVVGLAAGSATQVVVMAWLLARKAPRS